MSLGSTLSFWTLHLRSTLAVRVRMHFGTYALKYYKYFTFFFINKKNVFSLFIKRRSTNKIFFHLQRPRWSSNLVPAGENPIAGPQTLWHWRTNYRIGPVTFSLRICQSRSRRRSKWKLPCGLTRRLNNRFQRQLSHHFKVFATDCAALDYYSPTTPNMSSWVKKSQGSKFCRCFVPVNCNQLAVKRSIPEWCG